MSMSNYHRENHLIRAIHLIHQKYRHYLVTLIVLKSSNNQLNVKCLVGRFNLKDKISLIYLICAEFLLNINNSSNEMSLEKLKSLIYLKYHRKHPNIPINRLINLKHIINLIYLIYLISLICLMCLINLMNSMNLDET